MKISPAVLSALRENRPVVALESTVIAHGLPAPRNFEVPRAMEQAIHDAGATPAIIAILDGVIRVGLDDDEIVRLGTAGNVRKCSRRDLPIALAQGGDGATTVAATMFIANRAGISIFATGGIGGVHRGHPFDVSADLTELAQTPVCVVCAGAKAILDLPLTIEYLETHGVPVVGYQTNQFPAFYSRSSGLPVDVRCETAAEVAGIFRSQRGLNLPNGMLVTVPVPAGDELPGEVAEKAINRALAEADAKEIAGKELTPFLLARVSELTGRASERANVALLVNNARVAAEIAKELCAAR